MFLKSTLTANNIGHSIAFQWVPSHCGIKRKESSNPLTKVAYSLSDCVRGPLSKSRLKVILKRKPQNLSHQTWFTDSIWTSTLLHVDYWLMLPSATSCARNINTLLHRLPLDVAYTKHLLRRIHHADFSEGSCGREEECVRRLLLECWGFSIQCLQLQLRFLVIDNRHF